MPKIVDKRLKRDSIADAALKVFRQLGYHRTRMADIAGAANVGKGTLYEYFDNKADILRFAFDRYFDAFRRGSERVMATVGGPAEKLGALIAFALDHVDEWADHCAVYVDYLGVGRSGDEAVLLGGIYREMREIIELLVVEGQSEGVIDGELEPEGVAQFLLSLYDGIVLHPIFEERRNDPASLRAAALAIVRRGLRPIPEEPAQS